MSEHFILIAGPMVRASSWEPTADHLRQAGRSVQVPDLLAHCSAPPAWRAWSGRLLDRVERWDAPILVGHSSASVLVAELATLVPARSIIIVDGDIPPTRGRAPPVRPALRDFIRTRAGRNGSLPIWSRWFSADPQRTALIGLDRLAQDPAALASFENGLPIMTVDWFDDWVELAPWDHIPAGFVQTSPIYDHATAEAQRRGWPVERLSGTHLHPTLNPVETAKALLSIARQLDERAGRAGLTDPSRRTGPDRDRR
ncbi:alpha/beta hydrolase [Bradyrhizobium sp. STM 3809]|uniref:alpha/beta hydrolase n=1 Tax=Bradyrhizobium sp. STM 3809 TaxID=551936 RepID=UPI000240A3C4|nr:alpha/beta hydrolase [Bradyrhizobium sp. STM 3809]CCE03957.1 conserved hypothetical protein [Bradyrhizobium sp. STM 3809]